MNAVQEQMTNVSVNTPNACIKPCLTGWLTVAVAAALGALPSPASLLNRPRLMPCITVTPNIPPVKHAVFIYRLAVAAMVMIGAVITLDFAWCLADLTMAMLTVFNLIAIVLLSRQAIFLLNDYRQQKKEGKNPQFSKQQMPEIADKLEAW